MGLYAQVYSYGNFDTFLLLDEEYELTDADIALMEADELLPECTDEVLRAAAASFRDTHGQGIVGIKLCSDSQFFVVIFEGPAYVTTSTADGGTSYPPYELEVVARAHAWPTTFANFHRSMLTHISEESYGADWLS